MNHTTHTWGTAYICGAAGAITVSMFNFLFLLAYGHDCCAHRTDAAEHDDHGIKIPATNIA